MSSAETSGHPGVITLTTDFGLSDWYVAAMKGVILSLNPNATIVDISHQIPTGNRVAAGFVLEQARQHFPSGSIHVAVVDPGVGSSRRPMLLECDGHSYIGPDNGTFGLILKQAQHFEAFEISNPSFQASSKSHTFHGRDLFAPAAAHRSNGEKPTDFGPSISNIDLGPRPANGKNSQENQTETNGTIIYIDHFGNAISDLSPPASYPYTCATLALDDREIAFTIHDYYAQVPPGTALALRGSSSLLEIAINQGNAAKTLGIRIGMPIRLNP